MPKLKLAVCIPTYNRANVLADRLERMRLMQDHLALEICIADNASTDHTPTIVERFRTAFAGFHYLRQARTVGPEVNFYAALRSATFPYVIQIGDDDTIIEKSILQALARLEAEPELQAVFGNKIDYDFARKRQLQITNFITASEKYELDQAETLFGKYYYLEYQVVRRTALDADHYNEGMSYPTGWRLLHAALRHGPIRLEPLPLVWKSVSSDQIGHDNYTPERLTTVRSDSEWFAANRIPQLGPAARQTLARTALRRAVRYSSDSTVSAYKQKKYLAALHHAQKAAAHDYDTREYPRVVLDELIYGRLGEWLRQVLSAAPECASLVLEDHPACRKLAARAKGLLPKIRDWRVLPLEALEVDARWWTMSFTFDPRLADDASRLAGSPYVAVMDLLRGSTVAPWQFARLTGADDGPAVDDDDWSLPTLAFLLPEFAPDRAPFVPVELAGGAPIVSREVGAAPDRAFDDDPSTFWISAERSAEVKGRTWIGYSFAAPRTINAIRVTQDTNLGYRQDRILIEKSQDGGETWQPAVPGPYRLSGACTTIDLPPGEPARMWRLVAAGDNAVEPDHGWTVIKLEFFAPETPAADGLTPVELAGGAPIVSREVGAAPDRAFDDDPSTFWISAERSAEVKGRTWIGYSFAAPRTINAIRVTQDTNLGYRQDRILIEKSQDGGETWQPAVPGPYRLSGACTTIDLPPGEPARMWRLVAAGDNAVEPDHGWTVIKLEFFAPETLAADGLTPVELAGGAPIVSREVGAAPDRAFDDDPSTFWISAERSAEVKGRTWIGYSFAAPRTINAIRVTQDTNLGYRQDRILIEKSQDGGETWQPAVPGPYRLSGACTTIDLPPGEPARMWRLVAAGDNAVEPDHGWTVIKLEFFAPETPAADGLTPVELAGGAPIVSREVGAAPDRAFDDDPSTFWISAERSAEVKGRTWIGYSFAAPRTINAIRVTQDTNLGYRQDRILIEKSQDGGETWQPAVPGPYRLSGACTTIDLPPGEPARMWRLVAAGDNAVEPDHGWTVIKLEFFAPETPAADGAPSVSVADRPAATPEDERASRG